MNTIRTYLTFVAAVAAMALVAAEPSGGITQPSDEGLFPFVIRPDAVGTAADMSAILEAPAGKNGFLRRDGGRLVDGRGKTVRLNGVNLTASGCFPTHKEADRLAPHLARLGFNCVRFHYFETDAYRNSVQPPQPCLLKFDEKGRQVINEVMRDRMEYLIAQLKKLGIYVNINIHAARMLKEPDGVPKTPWANRGVDYFNEKIILAEMEFARDILGHVNPYTKLALKDDPAMAIVDINNENALMQVWWSRTMENEKIDPCYITEFYNRLAAAGYSNTTNGINKFIIETEKRYFRRMVAFIKGELGVKCPCVGTQQDYTASWVMSETCDIVDSHIYWNHPHFKKKPESSDPNRPAGLEWDLRNTAIVDAPASKGYSNSIVTRGSRRVEGRPFIVSEAACPYPCWYGSEYQPMLHAYAAFQDWSGVFVYSWNNATETFPDYNPYFFSHTARPDCVAHFPACAALFLRGDVAVAKEHVVVPADRDWLFEKAAKTGSYYWLYHATPEDCSPTPVSNAVFLRHGVAVDLSPAPEAKTPQVADLPAKGERHVSDTGELWLDPSTNSNGVFAVDVANVKMLTGHTDGKRFDLGGVVFEPGQTKLGWSAISLLSRDGNGFRPGARLLLAATGYTHNSGAVFRHQGGVNWGGSTAEFGKGAVVTEGIPLKVTLPSASARCWALDGAGARREEVPVTPAEGRSAISVGPRYRTVWYEIELKNL